MLISLNISVGSGSATVNVVTMQEIVAPAPVWAEVTATSGLASAIQTSTYRDPAFHEYWYEIDWGDPAATFTAPVNIPTAHQDATKTYAPQGGHVYETAGTKTITVTVTDKDGNTGTGTAQVVVQDPAVLYSGNRTILVDPANVGDNATYPSSQVVTTIEAARVAGNALNQTCRILLKRGETFSESVNFTNDIDNVHIGAWGAGNRPVWRPSSFTSTTPPCWIDKRALYPDIMLWDIDFQGYWDSTTESGNPGCDPIYSLELAWAVTNEAGSIPGNQIFVCYHNTRFDGFSKCQFGSIVNAPSIDLVWVFSNVEATNWQDYGFFGYGAMAISSPSRLALVGVASHQDANACQGPGAGEGEGKKTFTNDHGPFRTAGWDRVGISASSFFSRNGWSPGAPSDGTAANGAIRLFSEEDLDAYWCLDRVLAEGGYAIIDSDKASGSRAEGAVNFRMSNCILVGTGQTWHHIENSAPYTIENCLFVQPALVRTDTNNTFNQFIRHEFDNATNFPDEPVNQFMNTFLNMDDDTASKNTGTGIWNVYNEENEVYHAPNAGVTTDAPIDVSGTVAGVTPLYAGERRSTPKVTGTLGGDVTNGNTLTVSYPTNYGQSDFAAGNDHAIEIGSTIYYRTEGDISVSFGASNVTITNTSGVTWTSGAAYTANLVRTTHTTDATKASPSTIPLPRPQSGSAAYQTATTGRVTPYDYLFTTRTGSKSKGALEP